MNKGSKLVYAGISAIIAILVFVIASFAWLTLSVNPEVSGMQVGISSSRAILIRESTDDVWSETIDLSKTFQDVVPLRPVSTGDGINWYLPQYVGDGTLDTVDKFILDSKLEHANIKASENLTAAEQVALEEKGYYVYADFWLKTEEEICEVHLSVPKVNDDGTMDSVTDEEQKRGVYGSYVLGGLMYDKTDSTMKIDINSRKAESAVRVGFLIEQTKTEQTKIEDGQEAFHTEGAAFYIYEPNANLRSSKVKPAAGSTGKDNYDYVLGYTFNQAEYTAENYFITKPIMAGADGRTRTLGHIANDRLLIQKAGEWKKGADGTLGITKITNEELQNKQFSNYVSMGRFVKDNTKLITEGESPVRVLDGSVETGLSSDNIIVTLKKDEPQRIRMFVWIEGQDPDCWNDISAGNFLVNLELAGTVKEAAETN